MAMIGRLLEKTKVWIFWESLEPGDCELLIRPLDLKTYQKMSDRHTIEKKNAKGDIIKTKVNYDAWREELIRETLFGWENLFDSNNKPIPFSIEKALSVDESVFGTLTTTIVNAIKDVETINNGKTETERKNSLRTSTGEPPTQE